VPAVVTGGGGGDCGGGVPTDERGKPLNIECGGFYNGLIIRYNGRFIRQKTGAFSGPEDQPVEPVLPMLPHVRTTWREWRETYPDTDVYVGELPTRDKKPAGKAESKP